MLKLADMDSKSRFYNSAHWNKRKYACINEDVKNLSRGKKRNYLKRTKRKFLNLKKCNFETKISLNRLNSKLDMTEKSLNLKIDRQYPIWRIKIFFKIFFFWGGNSLVVQSGLCTFTAEGQSSVPGQRTNILKGTRCSQFKKCFFKLNYFLSSRVLETCRAVMEV